MEIKLIGMEIFDSNTEKELNELMNAFTKIVEKYHPKKETPKERKIPRDIRYYISKVSDILELPFIETVGILNQLPNATAIELLLKAIAIELDTKYKDHIKKSEHIYCISRIDGAIIEIKKRPIYFNNIAAFRTVEDAKLALDLLHSHGLHIVPNGEN